MRGLRRAVLAIALGFLVSVVVRFLGDGTTPPSSGGGWRELQGPDLR